MAKSYLCVLSVIALILGGAFAITEDDRNLLRAAARPIFEECGKEFNVTKEQALAAKETGNVDAIDSCFYACFFKKTGIIDAKGLFHADVMLEKNKKYINDEDHLAKVAEIGKICSSVNDEAVSDGDQGCQLSKLLVTCMLKQKAIFMPLGTA